jgi:hypothetical protein
LVVAAISMLLQNIRSYGSDTLSHEQAPGIRKCVPPSRSKPHGLPGAALDSHGVQPTIGQQTYVVTATSQDGQTATASLGSTVIAPPVIAPLANTVPPAVSGTATPGQTLVGFRTPLHDLRRLCGGSAGDRGHLGVRVPMR